MEVIKDTIEALKAEYWEILQKPELTEADRARVLAIETAIPSARETDLLRRATALASQVTARLEAQQRLADVALEVGPLPDDWSEADIPLATRDEFNAALEAYREVIGDE